MENLEMKNMLTNVKNTLHRLTDLGWQRKKVNEYKNEQKSFKQKTEQERWKKNKQSLEDLWVNIKHCKIHVIKIPEEQGNDQKVIKEKMAQIYPNLVKNINLQIQ